MASSGRFRPISTTQPQSLFESWKSSTGEETQTENQDLLCDNVVQPASHVTKIATETSCENERKSKACEHSEEIEPGGETHNASVEPPDDNQDLKIIPMELEGKTFSTSPMQIEQAVKMAVEHSSDQEMPTASGSPDQSNVTDVSMGSREEEEEEEGSNGYDNTGDGGDDGGDGNDGNAPREEPPLTQETLV